jgi:hypothetical protein
MKLSKNLPLCVLVAGLSLGAGCALHPTTVPLSDGFEAVSHPHRSFIDDPPPPRVALQRRAADGTVKEIWPSLYSTDTIVRKDLVLFVAERAYRDPDNVTHARLFAARPPELPLDLTDEVLWRWSKVNGRDFGSALQKYAAVSPAEDSGGVEVRLQFWANSVFGETHQDWPDTSSLHLDWSQIDEIMRAVKAKGTVQKDLRLHTEFIGEKF